MNYALIENGIVTNIICLLPMNADEFPNAVATEGLPVDIGDTYEDGRFYRNGEEIRQYGGLTEQAFAEVIMQEVSSYGY